MLHSTWGDTAWEDPVDRETNPERIQDYFFGSVATNSFGPTCSTE